MGIMMRIARPRRFIKTVGSRQLAVGSESEHLAANCQLPTAYCSISSLQCQPKIRRLEGAVNAFVAGAKSAFIKDVALKPDFGSEHRADAESSAKRATIDEHFEFQSLKVKIDPVKLASRKRIA